MREDSPTSYRPSERLPHEPQAQKRPGKMRCSPCYRFLLAASDFVGASKRIDISLSDKLIGFFVSHSQTTMIFHPSLRKRALYRRSRILFWRSFSSQYPLLLEGGFDFLHLGC